ncbi:MAG: hypothetical protein K2X55_20195 [Burkholderiaceae bacterium]|nr:hypothetical protein [Burkholderiaceae bacterium]
MHRDDADSRAIAVLGSMMVERTWWTSASHAAHSLINRIEANYRFN